MGLAAETLVTTVCAGGLILLAWWLFGLLLKPIPEQSGQRILLPGRGAGEALEQSVRAYIWLRDLGLLNCPIVIADVDLTPEGREVALRLAARWPGVMLWTVCDLLEYITKNET